MQAYKIYTCSIEVITEQGIAELSSVSGETTVLIVGDAAITFSAEGKASSR